MQAKPNVLGVTVAGDFWEVVVFGSGGNLGSSQVRLIGSPLVGFVQTFHYRL